MVKKTTADAFTFPHFGRGPKPMADKDINWYSSNPKVAQCRHGWVKGPGCEACKAEVNMVDRHGQSGGPTFTFPHPGRKPKTDTTEPRIIISVQRVVNGQTLSTYREIDLLRWQTRRSAKAVGREIDTMLHEMGWL